MQQGGAGGGAGAARGMGTLYIRELEVGWVQVGPLLKYRVYQKKQYY